MRIPDPGHGAKNARRVAGHGRCSICGEEVDFEIEEGFSLRETVCPACGGSRRSRDLAKVVVETFCPDGTAPLAENLRCLEDLSIYESQACGAVHQCLHGLPHYVCSEYLDGIPPGSTDERDVRCENMENLTFADNSFDLVITQDVFEHVKNPYSGFMEVRRVLKPGGVHIFTLPLHEGRDTVRRITSEDGENIFHLPSVYHGDSLREEGSLVYTDFGEDITHRLKSLDLPTRIAVHNKFYSPDAIPHIRDGESYENYIYYRQRGEVLKYLLYNSVVFVSEKREDSGRDGLGWTGERYVPWIGGDAIHYEHLHRYRFAKEFVKGKKVLDLGCGEGYGSFMLSEDAGFVVGVDINPACVRHASSKYSGKHLRFIEGSITDVPPDVRDSYDVIVCFEVLEHIDEHDKLMDEVKELLKPDGVFIVSTPDKRTYSDRPDYHNPFHVKELYQDEFRDLLSKKFGCVSLYGQRVEPGSRMFPLFECDIPEREFAIEKTGEGFVFSSAGDLTAKYL
ncbi:MAG: methyltransferase domain-containing protein, partial [Syntrophobacterales bacterium]|nr:methyltransferase domain-containing protein [Syntrophobacterales bacterium]